MSFYLYEMCKLCFYGSVSEWYQIMSELPAEDKGVYKQVILVEHQEVSHFYAKVYIVIMD